MLLVLSEAGVSKMCVCLLDWTRLKKCPQVLSVEGCVFWASRAAGLGDKEFGVSACGVRAAGRVAILLVQRAACRLRGSSNYSW